MNRIYRSIWSHKTGVFTAVSENTKGAGKNGASGGNSCVGSDGSGAGVHLAIKALAVSMMMAFGVSANAQLVGGVVKAGGANISNNAGGTVINQSTPNVVINWQRFNIPNGQTVQFVQPDANSVALNRVLGADPSSILGTLSANGKVFLLNPNGVLFGKGASVNVGGLVASTLNITDSDFMAGNYKFRAGDNNSGAVLNQGAISTNADGGFVALLGANVGNDGVISAKLGTVALAAGKAITLDVAGDGLLNVTVDQGALHALVRNGGLIQADGGQVLLSAQAAGNLLQNAVNNTGLIQAQSVENHNGVIRLLGDAGNAGNGGVTVGGTLDASGKATGQTGGTVHILGKAVNLSGAAIDASGTSGGGEVLIGGNFHGTGPQPNSQSTSLDSGVVINADATHAGNGGRIAVWSDGQTSVGGTLSARGGAISGAGGFIETSGKQVTLDKSTRVNTLADHGKTGLWLLDPVNYTISALGDETPANVAISLASSNRLITATNDITVGDALTWTTAQTLELRADHDVLINAAVTASTAGSGVVFTAGNDVLINAAVTASGAASLLTLSAGRDITSTNALTASANGAVISLTAGRTANVNVVTANGAGSIILRANQDVIVNGAVGADGGPVTLRADNDGTGPGVAGGTVRFVGVGAVTSPNTSIRFNPDGYINTSAEIAAYVTKVSAILDARAWVFGRGQDKVYDGNTGTTLAFAGTPSSGGDVTLIGGTAAFNNKNVGASKPITFNGYTIGGTDVVRFDLFAGAGTTTAAITPRALTVSATGTNKIYDGLTTDTVTLADNRIPGDVLTLSNAAANFADKNVGDAKVVAVTGISVTGADAGNYSPNTTATTAANITPAPLTVTATDVAKTYGQTPTVNAFTTVGLVNSETVGSATLTSPGIAATAGVAGSPYAITPSSATGGTFSPTNYTIVYVNGALTVVPAALTVIASDATKPYGQTVTPTAFSTAGLLNGDTVGSVIESSPGTPAGATVAGSPYAITPGSATGGTFVPGNYVIAYVNGALTVTPIPLTVTATDVTKTYGQTPTLSAFTTAGLVNGETVGSVTETSPGTAATASVAGSPYAITPSSATGGTFVPGNYTIGYVNGLLTVTPAPLTVTATDVTKIYGQTPTVSAFTTAGLVNGETVGSVTETSPGTAATASVVGSPYPITPSSATGGTFVPGNYTIGYVNGQLTVTPAPLTVKATDVSKVNGTTVVLNAFTTTGLVNGETVGSVTETSPGTVASATVAGNPYPITPTNATGGTFVPTNYTTVYVNGVLTVTPLIPPIVPTPPGGGTPIPPIEVPPVVVPPVVVPPVVVPPVDVPPVVVPPVDVPPVEVPPVVPVVVVPDDTPAPIIFSGTVGIPIVFFTDTPPGLQTLVPPPMVVLAPTPTVQPAPVVTPVLAPVETPPKPYVAPLYPRKQDRN